MASWFGTFVGMIGFRSVRTGGVTSIRPARVPWGAALSSNTSVNLRCFPHSPSVSSSRRQFWNWRGGDDKKWTFVDEAFQVRGGDGMAHGASLENNQDLAEASPKSYPVSSCSIQGFRSYMEDEFFITPNGEFACCFDGHGGPAVSRYLRKNLYANVQAVVPLMTPATTASSSTARLEETESTSWSTTRTGPLATANEGNETTGGAELHRVAALTPSAPTPQDYKTALEAALEKVDREVQRISHWSYQGSTAVVVWIHEHQGAAASDASPIEHDSDDSSGNETIPLTGQRTIIAANIGDSRAVLCRNNTAWDLTRDHKPNDPIETERIEQQGGKVVWCGDTDQDGEPILERGIYRVNGNLALSRAVGDRSERPAVTAEPEIITVPVQDEDDEFIILATDGLWDVLESNEAVALIQKLVEQGLPRDQVATWMVEESIRRGTYDNVTVLIIWLDRSAAALKSTQ
jgi:serine/threonine protein phosphatase PrpC